MIIAIDGPAASGKGTLARRLAAHYHLPHLDTGLLYRATALALVEAGLPLDDVDHAVQAARGLALTEYAESDLRGHAMGEAASQVAAMPEVRAELVRLQQDFATRSGGAVLDGRDIGSVICPGADVKIFVTATPEVRAARRVREMMERGEKPDPAMVLADIRRRDARDAGRSSAPLVKADDAIDLDTSTLDVEAAFQAALAIVEARHA
ncbi:MAG: (d)CMP kinase [Hyphomicrobiales bacterium]|nr:(d)CMP kinase [Hyphomicrobiales bacterium]